MSPVADAFVRSAAPDYNYGAAGGLSVSGGAALNRQGQQAGLLDTFMRFDMAPLVAAMEAEFGVGGWAPTVATLVLTEQGAPNNPVFNRGVGQFEIFWIPADTWAEGIGTPKDTVTDGVCYSDEALLADPAARVSLGVFSNLGADGELSFELDLPDLFTADVAAGSEVSFFLTAADDAVGFTFNSRDVGPPRLPPALRITGDAASGDVIPEPASMALLGMGLCLAALRRRRR